MIYVLVAFVLYFLFSWPRVKKSYLLQAMIPKLEKERKESEHRLSLEIDRLKSDRALFEQQIRKAVSQEYEEKLYMEGVKNLNLQQQIDNMRWANSGKKAPDPNDPDFTDYQELKAAYKDAQATISDLEDTVFSLKSNYKKIDNLRKELEEKSKIVSMFERLHDFENQEARLDHAAISSARRDTWKDLKGKPYKTLTPEQQSQIHFPVLDPSYVYFLPSHPTFHSVYWCYSLDNSPSPNKTTLCDAIQQKLKPCSKCVDPETYNDYLIQHKQPE